MNARIQKVSFVAVIALLLCIGATIMTSSPADAYVTVGKYWADIRWEWGYVPGCIHTNTWHLNLHLRDMSTNRDLINDHIASWWQNGPQFGIYNSGANGFCLQSRGTFTAIRNALTDFFSHSAGMPYWAAAAMAYPVAVICVCSLPFLAW